MGRGLSKEILYGNHSRGKSNDWRWASLQSIRLAMAAKDWQHVVKEVSSLPESADLEAFAKEIHRGFKTDEAPGDSSEISWLLETGELGELRLGLPVNLLSAPDSGPLAAELAEKIVKRFQEGEPLRNQMLDLLRGRSRGQGWQRAYQGIVEDVIERKMADDALRVYMAKRVNGQDLWCRYYCNSKVLHLLTEEQGSFTVCGKDISSKDQSQWLYANVGQWQEKTSKRCQKCQRREHPSDTRLIQQPQDTRAELSRQVQQRLEQEGFLSGGSGEQCYTYLYELVADIDEQLIIDDCCQRLHDLFAADRRQGWERLLGAEIDQIEDPLPSCSESELRELLEGIALTRSAVNSNYTAAAKARSFCKQLQLEQGFMHKPLRKEEHRHWARWSRAYCDNKPTQEAHLFVPDQLSTNAFIPVPLCGKKLIYPEHGRLRNRARERCQVCQKMSMSSGDT